MLKQFVFRFCILTIILSFAMPVSAAMQSANYRIPISVISGGGAPSMSATYDSNATVGQSTAIGDGMSSSFDNYAGYWYQAAALLNAATGYGDELAVDFGADGLWHYDGSLWSNLAGWDPDGDMEAWAGGLAVDFGASYGLWNYDGSSWTSIAGWDPEDMIDVNLY